MRISSYGFQEVSAPILGTHPSDRVLEVVRDLVHERAHGYFCLVIHRRLLLFVGSGLDDNILPTSLFGLLVCEEYHKNLAVGKP
jgi:hypothetical protein